MANFLFFPMKSVKKDSLNATDHNSSNVDALTSLDFINLLAQYKRAVYEHVFALSHHHSGKF